MICHPLPIMMIIAIAFVQCTMRSAKGCSWWVFFFRRVDFSVHGFAIRYPSIGQAWMESWARFRGYCDKIIPHGWGHQSRTIPRGHAWLIKMAFKGTSNVQSSTRSANFGRSGLRGFTQA